MSLSSLFEQITGAITHHSDKQQDTKFDPSSLLSHVQDIFGQHANDTGQHFNPGNTSRFGNVLPASQDRYGDPADQQGGGRSQQDRGRFGNIKPASQDPYGDPADH